MHLAGQERIGLRRHGGARTGCSGGAQTHSGTTGHGAGRASHQRAWRYGFDRQSTLDLIARHPGKFEVEALTANADAAGLAALAIRYKARMAVVADPEAYTTLAAALSGTGIEAAAGSDALVEAASRPADCVVAAIVGAAGLVPTLAAVRQGQRVALANKECLVTAGELFMREVAAAGAELLPVDSEHSAAFQAIGVSAPDEIEQITLTASGGPFRDWDMVRLAAATPEQALRHPNWSMGAKITIDSATLMNKGLELIEAFHLFPVAANRLDCIVHPQSIVHCLVSYRDGSVLAQLSSPDMRTRSRWLCRGRAVSMLRPSGSTSQHWDS